MLGLIGFFYRNFWPSKLYFSAAMPTFQIEERELEASHVSILAIDKAIADFGTLLRRDLFEGPNLRSNRWSRVGGKTAERTDSLNGSQVTSERPNAVLIELPNQRKDPKNAKQAEDQKHAQPIGSDAAPEATTSSLGATDQKGKPSQAA
ncbi:MAG: hypothetical protein AAF557_20655 [Pseudomonadota bacterium]